MIRLRLKSYRIYARSDRDANWFDWMMDDNERLALLWLEDRTNGPPLRFGKIPITGIGWGVFVCHEKDDDEWKFHRGTGRVRNVYNAMALAGMNYFPYLIIYDDELAVEMKLSGKLEGIVYEETC